MLGIRKWTVSSKSLPQWTSILVGRETVKNEQVDPWLPSGGDECGEGWQSRQRDGWGQGKHNPSHTCLTCWLIGCEIISICSLTQFCHSPTSYEYAYELYFQNETVNLRRAEVVLCKWVLTNWNLLQPNARLHQLLLVAFICLESLWIAIVVDTQ